MLRRRLCDDSATRILLTTQGRALWTTPRSRARELGFDVEAIRTLLRLQDDPDRSCESADTIARVQLGDMEKRIASLELLRAELEKMVRECATGRIGDCRVIETLADRSHNHGRLVEP